MRLDTDSIDLRARLAQVELERDAAIARETAAREEGEKERIALNARIRELMEQANQPRGTYRPEVETC